jgi:hypothetical protein
MTAIKASSASAPVPAGGAEAPEAFGNQTEPVAAVVPVPQEPADTMASASDAQTFVAIEATSYEIVTPVSAIPPGSDTDHKKMTTGTATSSGSNTEGSNTEITGASASHPAAFQDLQLKAEPAQTDNSAPRNNAQAAPAAAPELAPPEKNVQPLKSVALEFTPDGARDVKVRLSERGGEVHVSVHSTDPAVTRNLRAGVTDLASVLAHAGYDAKTWTSARQQQGNPQQREEPAPHRRNSKASAESFDGVLQQPDILQSPNILQ